MNKLAAVSGKAAAVLEQIVRVVAIAIVVVLVCTVFFQVARRTLTGRSIVEIEELSIVLAAWVAFLTVAYAARKKVHVRIEVFIEKLPFSVRNTLELAIHVAVFAATVLLVYHGWKLAGRKMMVPMTVLPMKQSVWFSAFPVGMGIALFFMLDNVIQTLNRYLTREPYRPVDLMEEAVKAELGEGESAAEFMGNKN